MYSVVMAVVSTEKATASTSTVTNASTLRRSAASAMVPISG